MITKVTNVITGVELKYCHPPEAAVRLAYIQYTLKNFNTWEYDTLDVPVKIGEKTVGCGDWIARRKMK